ncbi:MAG: hypothetical protein WCO60_20060 [Verrucomicrobiota bacterium]
MQHTPKQNPIKEASKLASVILNRLQNPHGVSIHQTTEGEKFVRIVNGEGAKCHDPFHDKEDAQGAICLHLAKSGFYSSDTLEPIDFPSLFSVVRSALRIGRTTQDESESKETSERIAREEAEAKTPWAVFAPLVSTKQARNTLATLRRLSEGYARLSGSRKAKATRQKQREVLVSIARLLRGAGFADVPLFNTGELTEPDSRGQRHPILRTPEAVAVVMHRFFAQMEEAKELLEAEKTASDIRREEYNLSKALVF